MALQSRAPTPLLKQLIAACNARRSAGGGAAEEDPSAGHPGVLAAQEGRVDVLQAVSGVCLRVEGGRLGGVWVA
jgi:hypothetical protein